MTSPMTEDERNERMIRNLRKLPENRRCINCHSLVPQYVCIDFWTFICTTCSGIHREFNHRVKSVSFAKFTSQEVSALQEGGNACAREIYFKEWDRYHPKPVIPYHPTRIRFYMKEAYVYKTYIGGKSFDKRSDDRSSKNRNEDGKSPDSQRDQDISSPPIMRPVRDILEEKVSPVQIIEPLKANRSASSSSMESSNKNPVAEVRTEGSLIDFDAVFDVREPPTPSTAQPPQLQNTTPSPAQTSTSLNNNWATFDSFQEMKTCHAPSDTKFLDVLSELSVSAPISYSTVSLEGVKSTAKKELPAWMPTQSSHQLSVAHQLPIHDQSMGQTPPGMQPQPRPYIGSFGSNNTSFRYPDHNQ